MLSVVRISFPADWYSTERIFVQTYLKHFIFMFEVIDLDRVRDICHRLYFDPPFCKKAISWKIHASGEVGKAVSFATGSNHLGTRDWLTSGCEWVEHQCLADITHHLAVFHQRRIYVYRCFPSSRQLVCNMIIIIIMKSWYQYNKSR